MANEYRLACQTVYQKPFWQGDPSATAWQGVMGDQLDERLDALYQARAVGYPRLPRDPEAPPYACPSDALQHLADERGIERAPGESETDHRVRIRDVWKYAAKYGTAAAPRLVAGWLGITTVKTFRREVWSTPPDIGSLYVRGFAHTVRAQFDVLIEKPHPWRERIWGASNTNWGDGGTWGSSATEAQIGFLRRNFRRFRSAGNTCTYLHVSFINGRVWGAGKWADGGVWGGSGQTMSVVIGEDHWASRGLM